MRGKYLSDIAGHPERRGSFAVVVGLEKGSSKSKLTESEDEGSSQGAQPFPNI